MPLVSFIIPCYRQAHFLPFAVRSVLAQSLQDVEAVVVDDGSPDDPKGHLGDLALDPRVIYIRQENQGLAEARNTGVRNSRAPLLNFLDADDWVAPEFCERMQPLLTADPNLGFVYCDLWRVHEDGARQTDYSVGRSRKILDGSILPSLLIGGYFTPHTVLLPRTVLDRVGLFDPDLGAHADWGLWLRIASTGYPVRYLDAKLVYYRLHADNMSRDAELMRTTRLMALRKLLRAFPDAVAEAMQELCQSNEDHYQGNRLLQDALHAADTRSAAAAERHADEMSAALTRIAWLEQSKDAHERYAKSWRLETERLKDIERRFHRYFEETQSWIATLQGAKEWLELQVEQARLEGEQLKAERLKETEQTKQTERLQDASSKGAAMGGSPLAD